MRVGRSWGPLWRAGGLEGRWRGSEHSGIRPGNGGDRVAFMAHAFDIDTEAQGLIDFVDASPTPSTRVRRPPHASRRPASPRWSRASRSRPRRVPTSSSGAARSSRGTRGGRMPLGWVPLPASGSSGRTPTAPTSGSSPTPTTSRPAGSRWASRSTAGRCSTRGSTGISASPAGSRCAGEGRATVETRLFHDTTPLLRVAQLAIHLDREQNEGLTLNRQQHLEPLWGLGDIPGDFRRYLSEQVGVPRRTSSAGTS